MQPIQELVPWQSTENLLAYPVLTGPGARSAWRDLSKPFPRVVLLADAKVWELYRDSLPGMEALPRWEVSGGEGAKTWTQLGQVLDFLAQAGASRDSLLLTLGGGSISDLGGLAASLFKRGVAVAHLPTTLLGQVDASIGGKTAINLASGKNLVGSFHAPRFVLADPDFLPSLPQTEWQSGLGEVVKSAMLAQAPVWSWLGEQAEALRTPAAVDPETLARIVAACVVTKAQWIQPDPTESHARKALNLGHTFGHAIEHAAGFGQVPHGVAVAFGLRLAVAASARTGRLTRPELAGELDERLEALGLPLRWTDWLPPETSAPVPEWTLDALRAGMHHDKKGQAGAPRFVLPLDIGRVLWDVPLDPLVLDGLWAEFLG